MIRICLLASVVLIASSCTSLKHTAYEQKVAPTPIIQSPLIADLEADPTVKVSATYNSFKGSEERARNAVLYSVMETNGCDVIINPVYKLVIGKKHIDASVKGICGKYTKFRKPNVEDFTILQELEPALPLFDSNFTIVSKPGLLIR